MDAPKKATAQMRYCWNCGDEMGVIERKFYDPHDTCGKIECNREARYAEEVERSEAHDQLDRDMGWY
jgi:hypothetical protein